MDAFTPIPSRCYRCRAITDNFSVCSRCRPNSRLSHVWVCTGYDGLAKQLLQVYKFQRAQTGAKSIGGFMSQTLPILSKDTLITSVPTASSRQRARGYDHTELLTKVIAQSSGLSHRNLVGRLGQSRQVGTNREMRLKQLQSAFYIKNRNSVKGFSILLVDDIVTTGGTLESVARILKQAGAKSVSAIVFAQKS